jgi:Rps23 Pro-64 3,4-dihydroxylase Tpa1-like proline 4-hydroxylase
MNDLNKNQEYIVIPNAVTVCDAEKVRDAFVGADYDLVRQTRRGHFDRMFPDSTSPIPSSEETYTAEFERSQFLERSELVKNTFYQSILPQLEHYSTTTFRNFDLRAYRMSPGGHFRMHLDDYTAELGFIWYLSKNWKWDWGGLLLTVDRKMDARVFLPQWNQLIILRHTAKQVPHCVTSVEQHAREPRMMLVGFLS